MYELSVKTTISAAHRLPGYNGPCANLHGHNWEVEVTWRVDDLGLNCHGMAFDFAALKRLLRETLADLEHSNLNRTMDKPTCENLASLIYRRMATKMYGKNVVSVAVEETQGYKATYYDEASL